MIGVKSKIKETSLVTIEVVGAEEGAVVDDPGVFERVRVGEGLEAIHAAVGEEGEGERGNVADQRGHAGEEEDDGGGRQGDPERAVVQFLFPGGDGGGVGAGGVEGLGARAVVEGEDEGVVLEALGLLHRLAQEPLHAGGQVTGATDGAQAHAVADEGLEFLPQVELQQAHQRPHLVLRAVTVLDRKRVKREHLNP